MLKKFCSRKLLNPWIMLMAVGLISGCRHESPNVIYMDDMVYSPAFKAQKEGAMRMPVQGTIPRNYVPYAYPNNPEAAGRELKNPLQPTQKVLQRGKAVFNSYCVACHGIKGDGDGLVTTKGFPRPPTLYNDKVRNWTDGRIFHLITTGSDSKVMPSYAAQVVPEDRWAIIHYIRALQRAQHPTPEDLKISNQESK